MGKIKFYMVVIEDYDGEGFTRLDIKHFRTEMEAEKHFNAELSQFKEDVPDYNDDEQYYVEEESTSFYWYPHGEYSTNHFRAYIEEIEI